MSSSSENNNNGRIARESERVRACARTRIDVFRGPAVALALLSELLLGAIGLNRLEPGAEGGLRALKSEAVEEEQEESEVDAEGASTFVRHTGHVRAERSQCCQKSHAVSDSLSKIVKHVRTSRHSLCNQ